MSLEVTWSDEVRRFHEFGPEEVARASRASSPPDVSWPPQKAKQRGAFDPDAAIARWDAFLSAHGHVSSEWRARDAATDALEKLAEDLWGRDGQLEASEANFWFHVFTSTDLFDELANPDRDAFDDASWRSGDPELYDADSARARLGAFSAARTQSRNYWSIHTFMWIGWFLDAALDPADSVQIVCEVFTRRDGAQLLSKIRPYAADHPTTLARVASLEQHFVLADDSHVDRNDQEAIASMLAVIPSQAIAHTMTTAVGKQKNYEYRIPLWVHIQLVNDHALTIKTLNKMPFSLSTWEERDGDLAPANLVALFLELGYAGLPDLVKLGANRNNKSSLANLLQHICRIHAPEMANALAQVDGKAEAQGLERAYLSSEGANAVSGLLALASRRGKKRDLALELLRTYLDAGHRDLVERLLDDAPKAGAKVVREELLSKTPEDAPPVNLDATVDELPEALRTIAALDPKVPFLDGLDPSRLPTLVLASSGKRIPDAVTERIGAALRLKYEGYQRSGHLIEGYGLRNVVGDAQRDAVLALDALKGAVTTESSSALWQHLYDQALVSRNRWSPGADVIMSVIELGSEADYQRLEMSMRNRSSGFSEWSAMVAMDALIETGERSAWAAVLEASVRVRDESLRKAAHGRLARLRERRGWTLGELHDRLVPTCRLDDRGTHVFDYGSRQFELVFQGAFDVAITDSDGKRYARLPPARKADDRELVKAAKADFKIIKEQIKLVVETQTRRLQEDLLTARRWTARSWREDVLSHPLMRHFARTLVWGHYDDDGALLSTFVPDIDGGCMSADFDEVELADDASIAIAHPLELGEHGIHQWDAALADSELQQPFDQLHRTTYPMDTWGEHMPWISRNAGHWQMYEGLKKTRRWDGLIKRTKSSKRKFGARDLGESGFKTRLCFHKGAWTLAKGQEQPPDGLYFFGADAQPEPDAILDPQTDLPERVVSEVIREVLDAYASEER